MKSEKYIIDAVLIRPARQKDVPGFVPVSILGYGMRGALPMLLRVILDCGSFASSAEVSEIELTVTIPSGDAERVMKALAAHISREPKALLSRNKE